MEEVAPKMARRRGSDARQSPAFSLLLSQVKLVWEAFPEAFCLHDQTI